VLGDVERAVRHGRAVRDVGRAVRTVVWERTAGQLVQLVLAVVVLAVLPSPVRPALPALALGLVVIVVLARVGAGAASGRLARVLGAARADLRAGLLARGVCGPVVLASTIVVAGHLATFVVAARTAGATAPLTELLPLTLLALLAMGVPANVAGFGPREGVAAWAFAAAGSTAAQGVATAVVYGALVLVAALPGAVVLLARRRAARAGGDAR
jgi:uncharacterized membrane protein YbhN (UPF0104 family)